MGTEQLRRVQLADLRASAQARRRELQNPSLPQREVSVETALELTGFASQVQENPWEERPTAIAEKVIKAAGDIRNLYTDLGAQISDAGIVVYPGSGLDAGPVVFNTPLVVMVDEIPLLKGNARLYDEKRNTSKILQKIITSAPLEGITMRALLADSQVGDETEGVLQKAQISAISYIHNQTFIGHTEDVSGEPNDEKGEALPGILGSLMALGVNLEEVTLRRLHDGIRFDFVLDSQPKTVVYFNRQLSGHSAVQKPFNFSEERFRNEIRSSQLILNIISEYFDRDKPMVLFSRADNMRTGEDLIDAIKPRKFDVIVAEDELKGFRYKDVIEQDDYAMELFHPQEGRYGEISQFGYSSIDRIHIARLKTTRNTSGSTRRGNIQ